MTFEGTPPELLALRRHVDDLVQCEYLDEFVLNQEEDSKVRDTPDEVIN